MAYRSKAEREKFFKLYKEGKISKEKWEQWEQETDVGKLPDRAPKKTSLIRRPRRTK